MFWLVVFLPLRIRGYTAEAPLHNLRWLDIALAVDLQALRLVSILNLINNTIK